MCDLHLKKDHMSMSNQYFGSTQYIERSEVRLLSVTCELWLQACLYVCVCIYIMITTLCVVV